MSRRSSYQLNRESVDNYDEDASFLTHAAPQAGHSHRPQQKTSNSNNHHHKDDDDEYEYGHGHLREQHSSQKATFSTTTTSTSGRLVSSQRGATTTKTTTTTTTTTTSSAIPVDEISVLTLAAIDPLSPATYPEALSPSSPVPIQLPQLQQQQQEPPYSKWSTIIHQLSFLATGIFSTMGVQWVYYQGGACKLHLTPPFIPHCLFMDDCSLHLRLFLLPLSS
jgi:hypothetical protein